MGLKAKTKKIIVFSVGSILILVGFIIGGVWNIIFESIVHSQLALAPGSTSYSIWADLKLPMYLDIYMFHFENAKEYFDSLTPPSTPIKPHFVERGPYVFKEHHLRTNVQWNDNYTITFQQIRTWYFVPSMSIGSLDDIITFVNPIPLTAVKILDKIDPVFKIIIDRLMNKLEDKRLYKSETVKNALFDGFDDKMLDLIKAANYSIDMPFDKFAWFAGRNNSASYDGTFNMYTGEDDLSKLGLVKAWNYQTSTNFYQPNTECAEVKGTTGELWPAPKDNRSQVQIFVPDICTYMTLQYDQDIIHHDVTGYEYVASKKNLATTDDHLCYCADLKKCQPAGTLDISKCKFNAPVYVSFPHFYESSQSYLNPIEGLSPKKELHEFTMALEPLTGIPLQAHGRLQINLKLEPYNDFTMFKNLEEIYLPSFWFAQRAAADEDTSSLLRLLLLLPTIGQATFFGIGGIGVLIVLVGIGITLRKGWGQKEDRLLL